MGLTGSQYGYLAYPTGAIKEGFDLAKDLFRPPYGRISSEVWEDTKKDFQNNHKGIQYMFQNPDASSDDLMNYAIGLAKKEQEYKPKPMLYGYIINSENAPGN